MSSKFCKYLYTAKNINKFVMFVLQLIVYCDIKIYHEAQ